MMNYLGSSIGGGTGGAPTMPGSIPGGQIDPVSGAPAMPAGPPAGMPAAPGMMPDPGPAQYAAVTQEDGSILLHIKNADGSLGPAVKIINPIKPKQAGGGGGGQ